MSKLNPLVETVDCATFMYISVDCIKSPFFSLSHLILISWQMFELFADSMQPSSSLPPHQRPSTSVCCQPWKQRARTTYLFGQYDENDDRTIGYDAQAWYDERRYDCNCRHSPFCSYVLDFCSNNDVDFFFATNTNVSIDELFAALWMSTFSLSTTKTSTFRLD